MVKSGIRINYFDYFRGVAILLIVAGHCYHPWVIDTLPEMFIANLITGGTALFVFISGFFFHRIFHSNFQFVNFSIKKLNNVLLPYLTLSSAAFTIFVVARNYPSIIGGTDETRNSILLYFKYLWTGQMLVAYWYVPFIMIIFAMSPLFIQYIKLSLALQLTIFAILLGVSSLVHRPSHNLSPIHSVIYFIPLYLLGIIYSIKEDEIIKVIKDKCLALGAATVGISMIQVIHNNSYGNYQKSAILSYAGFDLMIIQKTLMIFFILSILKKIDDKEIWILKYLASISFALFFLHPWVLKTLSWWDITQYLSFIPGAIIFPIQTIFVIIVSITIATFCKKILSHRSLYIIGY